MMSIESKASERSWLGRESVILTVAMSVNRSSSRKVQKVLI